jgi:small-conductance mechanosensitive channel
MNPAQRIDNGPTARCVAFVAALAVFLGVGAYLLRLGLSSLRTGQFTNQRTGESITGWFAKFCGLFCLVVGALSLFGGILVSVLVLR